MTNRLFFCRLGFCGGADPDGVFMYDVLVGLGKAGGVVYVPAEGHEERVEELVAELSFVIVGVFVGFDVAVEGFYESCDLFGNVHTIFALSLSRTVDIIQISRIRASDITDCGLVEQGRFD